MEDMRFQRTEQLIMDATKSLLEKKGIDEIKITEICSRASISRNAFYGHYCDKYDLIEKMTMSFISTLKEDLLAIHGEVGESDLNKRTIECIISYFERNNDMLTLLVKNDSLFWHRFQENMASLLFVKAPKNSLQRVFAEFCSGGMCVCLESYYSGRAKIDHDEFVANLSYIARMASENNPAKIDKK